MQLSFNTKEKIIVSLLGLFIIFSLVVRSINLNYNSPFNDEAVYVVVGRMGIFQGDWWTYNAAAWMAGQPYIYPTLSSIAYMVGGILGSRFLNVLFGVLTIEAVFLWTLQLANFKSWHNLLAAFISAVIAGASAVALYVSRLATYDIPSFYFLILSLIFLVKAEKPNQNLGKLYFLSALFLLISFLTKIVILLYIPFIVAYSFYKARKLGQNSVHFWQKYFLMPIAIIGISYFIWNWTNIASYASSQAAREKTELFKILKTFWENTSIVWFLWAISSIGLFIKKQFALWATLTLTSLLILGSHLASYRWPTLDKHTYLTILFLCPLIGIGLTNFIKLFKNSAYQTISLILLATTLSLFVGYSYKDSQRFNRLWQNNDKVLNYITKNTKPGDKILAEVGAAAILANYDHNYPTYTSTFDWFTYKKESGENAYKLAISEGYFNFIELDRGDSTSDGVHSNMHNLVLEHIDENYKQVYKDGDYVVFRRVF